MQTARRQYKRFVSCRFNRVTPAAESSRVESSDREDVETISGYRFGGGRRIASHEAVEEARVSDLDRDEEAIVESLAAARVPPKSTFRAPRRIGKREELIRPDVGRTAVRPEVRFQSSRLMTFASGHRLRRIEEHALAHGARQAEPRHPYTQHQQRGGFRRRKRCVPFTSGLFPTLLRYRAIVSRAACGHRDSQPWCHRSTRRENWDPHDDRIGRAARRSRRRHRRLELQLGRRNLRTGTGDSVSIDYPAIVPRVGSRTGLGHREATREMRAFERHDGTRPVRQPSRSHAGRPGCSETTG